MTQLLLTPILKHQTNVLETPCILFALGRMCSSACAQLQEKPPGSEYVYTPYSVDDIKL